MRTVRELNQFSERDIRVDCAKASPRLLLRWANETLRTHRHIDVVDVDIQSSESKLLLNKEVMKLLDAHVVRVIIGTHTGWPIFSRWSTHEAVAKAFSQWHVRCDRPVSTYTGCLERYLRGCKTDPAARFDWAEMLRRRCYHESAYGKVATFDGELIFDNPRLVHPDGALISST